MTSSTNKYAGLPDIDLDQQDIYETPDIQDDVSTVPTSLSDTEDQDIEREGFSIEAARARFANERVDAEYADFSDTLIARRKGQSYRTSREEIPRQEETLDERIARIRREMEEVKRELSVQGKTREEVEDWETLMRGFSSDESASNLLTTRLQKVSSPTVQDSHTIMYTLSYSPSETTQLSALSSRLSHLESLLGLPLTPTSPPILPTLSHLSSKLALMTSPSHLETLQSRIKSLITDLTQLEEKREAARQRALLDPEDAPIPEQSDVTRKVNALYATLATIDSVAPLVGGVVDRLRSMARVHADAAGVTGGVKTVEEGLGRMEGEVKEWRAALEKVEMGMKDVGGKVGGAVQQVEKVVKDLEGRVKEMGI